MHSLDIEVLTQASTWLKAGHVTWLATVITTWGSAPRQPGAMAAIRNDGTVAGSVSGGCIEADLIERVAQSGFPPHPSLTEYGITREGAARFGLPCGGRLQLLIEPLAGQQWPAELLERIQQQHLVARELRLNAGTTRLRPAMPWETLHLDGDRLIAVYGPRRRLLIIGAGEISRLLSGIAAALDYQVLICDPREEYTREWSSPHAALVPGMPDDAVLALAPDTHTAIVAVTHDLKLDDMALLEALKSPAFYVGALGSTVSQGRRRERLKMFDLTETEIGRLHGPVGLPIGSRTPAEIAVSIMAEIIAVQNASHIAGQSAPSDQANHGMCDTASFAWEIAKTESRVDEDAVAKSSEAVLVAPSGGSA